MSILIPALLEEKVLGKNDFGKALLERTYKHPKTGKPYGYGIFDYKGGTVRPSIFLPLTANRNVIAIRQFREGAGEEILELPGGNPKKGQTAEDVVRSELREETGYKAGAIINLAPKKPIYIEPATFPTPMHPFLVTGCVKAGEQALDKTENIEVEIIPLHEWIAMCLDGRIVCGKSLAITFLALPYLGLKIAHYYS